MGTTNFRINDIDWEDGFAGPQEVVIGLPDSLVLSNMPSETEGGGKALLEWQQEWDDTIADKIEALLGHRSLDFSFGPAEDDEPLTVGKSE
jgi:hypothetical protein